MSKTSFLYLVIFLSLFSRLSKADCPVDEKDPDAQHRWLRSMVFEYMETRDIEKKTGNDHKRKQITETVENCRKKIKTPEFSACTQFFWEFLQAPFQDSEADESNHPELNRQLADIREKSEPYVGIRRLPEELKSGPFFEALNRVNFSSSVTVESLYKELDAINYKIGTQGGGAEARWKMLAYFNTRVATSLDDTGIGRVLIQVPAEYFEKIGQTVRDLYVQLTEKSSSGPKKLSKAIPSQYSVLAVPKKPDGTWSPEFYIVDHIRSDPQEGVPRKLMERPNFDSFSNCHTCHFSGPIAMLPSNDEEAFPKGAPENSEEISKALIDRMKKQKSTQYGSLPISRDFSDQFLRGFDKNWDEAKENLVGKHGLLPHEDMFKKIVLGCNSCHNGKMRNMIPPTLAAENMINGHVKTLGQMPPGSEYRKDVRETITRFYIEMQRIQLRVVLTEKVCK